VIHVSNDASNPTLVKAVTLAFFSYSNLNIICGSSSMGSCCSKPIASDDQNLEKVKNLSKPKTTKMVKIAVIYYSTYGHIYKMAQSIAKGINSVDGCEAVLLQVQETLSPEILAKMHAPPKPDVPVVNVAELPSYDGFMFGMPTRFGMMAAQMKAMFDATGGHWQSGALVNKPAGIFFSTATQNGGQETTGKLVIWFFVFFSNSTSPHLALLFSIFFLSSLQPSLLSLS
jgi:NADPH-dependent FMN reductase